MESIKLFCYTNYCSVISGGIPSELINGICVKNNNYLDEISEMFPNAIIFDSKKKVLRYQLLNIQNNYESMTKR